MQTSSLHIKVTHTHTHSHSPILPVIYGGGSSLGLHPPFLHLLSELLHLWERGGGGVWDLGLWVEAALV